MGPAGGRAVDRAPVAGPGAVSRVCAPRQARTAGATGFTSLRNATGYPARRNVASTLPAGGVATPRGRRELSANAPPPMRNPTEKTAAGSISRSCCPAARIRSGPARHAPYRAWSLCSHTITLFVPGGVQCPGHGPVVPDPRAEAVLSHQGPLDEDRVEPRHRVGQDRRRPMQRVAEERRPGAGGVPLELQIDASDGERPGGLPALPRIADQRLHLALLELVEEAVAEHLPHRPRRQPLVGLPALVKPRLERHHLEAEMLVEGADHRGLGRGELRDAMTVLTEEDDPPIADGLAHRGDVERLDGPDDRLDILRVRPRDEAREMDG